MRHTRSCPRFIDMSLPCSCGGLSDDNTEGYPAGGGGLPIVAPTPQVLEHTAHCPVRAMAAGDEACTCGAGGPKVTDDNPYRDVEYARSLVKRAEALATESPDLARFLLELAREARLLAELQGKWEY